MSNANFTFENNQYLYFDHPHNRTRTTERAVEIPISLDFIKKFSNNLIEVGCVTPHYADLNHPVIDLSENHPKSTKEDATTFNYTNKNVLSISTVEHVGLNDYSIEEKEKDASIKLCKKIFSESLNYFITWPLGYNLHLDSWAFENTNGFFISRKEEDKYSWQQKQFSQLSAEDKRYGTFFCANSIIILTNIKTS
jgi:hypothetical protein